MLQICVQTCCGTISRLKGPYIACEALEIYLGISAVVVAAAAVVVVAVVVVDVVIVVVSVLFRLLVITRHHEVRLRRH